MKKPKYLFWIFFASSNYTRLTHRKSFTLIILMSTVIIRQLQVYDSKTRNRRVSNIDFATLIK